MNQDMMNFFQLGGQAPTEMGGMTTNILGPTGAGIAPVGNGLLEQLKGLFGGGAGGEGTGLGMNVGTGQLALGGLQTLGNLYGSHQANKLAKDQFKFTKDVTNTNLTNQIQSYNTALADRSRARGAMEGQDQSSVEQYIDQNKLRR